MTDHNLRDIASRCEAKLHGMRRTQEGAVISFVVHPNEIPRALMLDPLGTRYHLAFCAIGDDEQPLIQCTCGDRPARHCPVHNDPSPVGGTEEYRKYTDRGRADATTAGLTAKARYAAMPPNEQAKVRAGRLPDDERFRAWVAHKLGEPVGDGVDHETAAQFIRDRCCGGESRRAIATDPEAMDKFIALETQYLIDIGQITGPR